MRKHAAVTTLCLLAAACASRGSGVAPGSDNPRLLGACCPESDVGIFTLMRQYEGTAESARPPELAILPYRISSGLTERERLVVRDQRSWDALWSRIRGSHRPTTAPPAVSFAREMLVVTSMGTQRTGGYIVTIDSVAARGARLFVYLRERSPGPRCGVTAALTAPVALARVERSDLPVSFVSESVVRDC
jgi:hypothetical protein